MDDKRKPWKEMTSAEKRARSAFLKAERKTARLAREEDWRSRVTAHFTWLETDYGFQFMGIESPGWWGTLAHYQSPLLHIQIDRSVEIDSVEIRIDRLIEGEIPQYPIFINPDTPINHLFLNQLLDERAPEALKTLLAMRGLDGDAVEASLTFQADALRRYCADILRGDFMLFDSIAVKLHDDAREHPQVIKVWVSDSSQPGDEYPLVDTIHRLFPQQPIQVGRYRAGKKRGAKSTPPSDTGAPSE